MASIFGMKVRQSMLFPVYRDHDTKESAYLRHATSIPNNPILPQSSVLGRERRRVRFWTKSPRVAQD